MEKSNTATYLIAALASAFLFVGATLASKALLEDVQPQALAGLLYLGAVVGVLPMLFREKAFRWPWFAGMKTVLLLMGAILPARPMAKTEFRGFAPIGVLE